MQAVPVPAYLIEVDGLMPFARRMRSLRRALAWLLHGIVALQIEFPVQVLVSESANELASERVVALASRRQRELSRGCSENADTFQGDSALAGRSLAADGIAALSSAVLAQRWTSSARAARPSVACLCSRQHNQSSAS